MSASILLDISDGVARLRLNRPAALNALDLPAAEALRDAVAVIEAAPGLRCVLLTGAGRAFAAGGDITAMAAAGEQAPALVARIIDAVHPAVEGLARQPAPVVAVVQGAAAGAGVSLALGADILIMADTARLTLGYGALGTVPDCGGSFHLARRLGPGRALLWLAENRAMPAEEALALGLAHRVVPEADLEAEAEALCARLVAGPRLALAAARSLLRGAAQRDLPDHLTAERNAFLQCAGTADFREGLAAFLARRPARFAN